MNKEDLVFDHQGKLDQVCVAKWPDGAQIWREIQREEIVFEFRQRSKDPLMDHIISQVGLFPSFSLRDGHFHSMPAVREEWNEMVPYVRWFSNELGFFQWPRTPMKPSDFSDVDPVVSWFVNLDDALSVAKILDDQLFRVRVVMKDSPGTTVRDAAKEIGFDSDLVEQIEHFADLLLEPAWVFLDWSKLMGQGKLIFGLRKPNHSYLGGAVGRKRHPEVSYSDAMTDMEAPSLVAFVEMLLKLTPSSAVPVFRGLAAVLVFRGQDDADAWFRDHVMIGNFTIPEEEMEIFKILDETPPYLLPNDEFSHWVMSRISA